MNRKNGKIKGVRARVLAAMTIFVLIVAGTVWGGFAEDTLEEVFDKGFTVTVKSPTDPIYQFLDDANVTLDFYRIAEATPKGDSDVLDVEWVDRFEEVGAAWEEAEKKAVSGDTPIKAADIDALAQGAAQIILAGVPEYKSSQSSSDANTNPDKSGTLDTAVKLENKGGIYLIIAHGDVAGYKITDNSDADAPRLSTAAVGGSKLYQFAPMLVSVPNKQVVNLKEKGTIKEKDTGETLAEYPIGYSSISSDQPWTGDVEINAKVGVKDMGGSLKITKTLLGIEETEGFDKPVTVVFDVHVTKGEQTVYNGEITMVFTEPGTQTKTINNLPYGAHAVVKEVFATGGYALIMAGDVEGADTVELPIVKDSPATATFVNGPSGSESGSAGGGSIINHFAADEGGVWDLDSSTKTYEDGTPKPLGNNDFEL